jgi:hypothetical protein
MKKFVLVLMALVLSACMLGKVPVEPSASAPPALPGSTPTLVQAAPTAMARAGNNNPFGILITLDSQPRESMVKALGVSYFRPNQAILADQWSGACTQCDRALQIGLKLILTVRANGGRQVASTAPGNLTAYQKIVGDILDKYHTDVLVVENEENSANFYTGTPEQYGEELKAACQVAHNKGIKCANGGMVSNDVALLVWDSYFEGGASAQACDFAKRALTSNQAQRVCGIKTLDQLPAQMQATLTKDKAFLQQYKTSAADYMNFHWYIADAKALGEAGAFLQSAVGLPLMTNEMGQQDKDPATVTNLLAEALALKLPYVIWFSIDPTEKVLNNPDKSLIPMPLNNTDSTLLPSGEAFAAFIKAHFK